jgi:hypothetical protein
MSRRLLVILLVFFLLFSSLELKTTALNAAQDTLPKGIHLYWTDDVSTTMTITWKTATEASGDTVFYDAVSRKGTKDPTKAYAFSVTGVHHTIKGINGFIHDVKLTKLTPGATYYFVSGGSDGYSAERKFQTIQKNPSNVRFVFGGDSRSGAQDFPAGRDKISQLVATYNPQFVIFCGDFVNDALADEDWDIWFNHMDSAWIDSQGYTIPIMPFLGNHEVGTSNEFQTTNADASFYHEYFALPNWYSFDIAPYLHFTALDSMTFADPHSEQYLWANQDLAKTKSAAWKIVGWHIPAYDLTSEPREGTGFELLPLINEYHVNVVVNGDTHLYERLQPMNSSTSDGSYFSSSVGTIDVVSGGWGAPLYMHYPSWRDAFGPISQYNFTLFNVSSTTLSVQAIDVNNKVMDNFTIGKELPAPEIVVKGRTSTYALDVAGPTPSQTFGNGEFPSIAGLSKVGDGTVAAAGTAWSSTNGSWVKGEYDVFLDILFKKMVPNAKKVLWYQGYGTSFTTKECSDLISALKTLGYEVVGDDKPITDSLLSSYDILVIPQLRLGSGYDGGDPTLLPWSDVDAIKKFVESGKGLLVMDACDYGGNNFSRVQNKILEGVGSGLSIQSDTVYDDTNNWNKKWYPTVDVDPNTDIGKAYLSRTGKTQLSLFELCTVIRASPTYLEKVTGGARTIVDGRKIMGDARLIIEAEKGTEGFVRIQNLGSSGPQKVFGAVGEPKILKCVDISSDIPTDKIKWPVTIEVYYTPDELKKFGLNNANSLWLYYWDAEQGIWRLCPESGVNTNRNVVVASAYQFGKFAIMPGPLQMP